MLSRFIYLLFIVIAPVMTYGQELFSAEGSEFKDPKKVIDAQLVSLDHQMAMTKKSLDKMGQLRQEIAEYQRIQMLYLENTRDAKLLFQMTKGAALLQEEIMSAQMTHLFAPEFMKELNLLTRIYKKKSKP